MSLSINPKLKFQSQSLSSKPSTQLPKLVKLSSLILLLTSKTSLTLKSLLILKTKFQLAMKSHQLWRRTTVKINKSTFYSKDKTNLPNKSSSTSTVSTKKSLFLTTRPSSPKFKKNSQLSAKNNPSQLNSNSVQLTKKNSTSSASLAMLNKLKITKQFLMLNLLKRMNSSWKLTLS